MKCIQFLHCNYALMLFLENKEFSRSPSAPQTSHILPHNLLRKEFSC